MVGDVDFVGQIAKFDPTKGFGWVGLTSLSPQGIILRGDILIHANNCPDFGQRASIVAGAWVKFHIEPNPKRDGEYRTSWGTVFLSEEPTPIPAQATAASVTTEAPLSKIARRVSKFFGV